MYNRYCLARYWRIGQIDIHQADAYHPRRGLLGRGQARLHQTDLPEHLHGHAEHDQRHGRPQHRVQGIGRQSECVPVSFSSTSVAGMFFLLEVEVVVKVVAP